jgi:transposase
LSCTKCDCIVQAAAASRPIERGLAGPGLLAHVLVSKYCDHQPLYRQSEIYARQGVELERSTLADWVGGSAHLLEPLVEALRRYVMAASKLHADDTPVPVLSPGNGRTKTGRLWTYVRDDRPAGDPAAPAVWLAYSPDRKGRPVAGAERRLDTHHPVKMFLEATYLSSLKEVRERLPTSIASAIAGWVAE